LPSRQLPGALDSIGQIGYKLGLKKESDHLAYVELSSNESYESALRRFKRKVQQEAIIKEVKKHSVYLKPGEKKRLKQQQSMKRIRKKLRRDTTDI
jgi:small subunit ribosomal protein S21